MNDEQINEAITEATRLWDYPYSSDTKRMYDFCADLSAMHEAEKCLPEKYRPEYIFQLHGITDGDMNAQGDFLDRATLYYPVVCATARERAEAFLRALGKWEEEE